MVNGVSVSLVHRLFKRHLSIARTVQSKWYNDYCAVDWEGGEQTRLSSDLSHYAGVCMEWLRKIMRVADVRAEI